MNGEIAMFLVLLGISIPLSWLMLEERPRSAATAQLVTCPWLSPKVMSSDPTPQPGIEPGSSA